MLLQSRRLTWGECLVGARRNELTPQDIEPIGYETRNERRVPELLGRTFASG
jgi:hypothetical protein